MYMLDSKIAFLAFFYSEEVLHNPQHLQASAFTLNFFIIKSFLHDGKELIWMSLPVCWQVFFSLIFQNWMLIWSFQP